MKIISSQGDTAYLEHIRQHKEDNIDCLAAIFNWRHKSKEVTKKEAHCLLRAYIKPDGSSVIVLAAMRSSILDYPAPDYFHSYQPFGDFVDLVNLLYPILEENFGVIPEKIHWISQTGNFSQWEHESVPDDFFHEPLGFKEERFNEGETNDRWCGIRREEIDKYVPFELEPGAELIESLDWGDYPTGWGLITK